MILDLVADLDAALEGMPVGHTRRALLGDIDRLVRQRINELHRHPTALFQALWNELMEAPRAAEWGDTLTSTSSTKPISSDWMQACLASKTKRTPDFPWLRLTGASHAPFRWEETILTVSPVIVVAMAPNERYVCSGDMLRQFKVWDSDTHALLAEIDLEEMIGNPTLIEFSGDSRFIACTTGDGEIAVVDWRMGSVVIQNRDIGPERKWGFQQAWFAEDLSSVTFVGRWGDVFVYRLSGGQAGELLRQFKSPASQGVYRNEGTVFWTYDFRESPPTDQSGQSQFVKTGVYQISCVDLSTGARRDVLKIEGSQGLANMIVSPDGSRLAWCDSDQIQVFDCATGQRISCVSAPPRDGRNWWSFRYGELNKPSECHPVWSTDSRCMAAMLASSSGNLHHSHAQVWIWDTDTGEVHWRIPVHGKLTNLKSMALAAGGRRLLHDARGCQLVTQMPTREPDAPGLCDWDEEVVSFSLAEDGVTAACATHSGSVHLLDLESHRRVAALPSEVPRKVDYLQLSSDGKQLAWWQREQGPEQLMLADTGSLAPRSITQGLPGSLQFSEDGSLLTSAGKEVICIPTKSVECQFRLSLPSATNSYFVISSDNRWIATASHQTCLWKLSRGDSSTHLLGTDDRSDPRGFHLSGDGRRLVVRAHRVDASSRFLTGLIDFEQNSLVWEHEELEKLLIYADFGPGPECVTFTKRPGILRLINVVSKTVVAEARISNAEMYGIAVSRDGRWIAGAGYDGQVRLVDLQQGGAVSSLIACEKNVLFVQFNRSGSSLLSLGEAARDAEGRVRIWNTLTQQVVFEFDHPGTINTASLSPDGRHIACVCGNNTLSLWRVGQPEPIWEVLVEKLDSRSLQASAGWSPDGRSLSHSLTSGDVIERDLVNGCEVRRWNLPAANVMTPEYTPDGESLIVCGNSPVVNLFDARTGEPKILLRGHRQPVTTICFSSRSNLCATNSDDGDVIVWDIDRGDAVAHQSLKFDHGRTRLAHVAGDDRVLMESPTGITAWDLVQNVQVEGAEVLDLLSEAQRDGFVPLNRSMQSGLEIRCRRTSQAVAWHENRSLACEVSRDGRKWALLEQGRLLLFELCFGIHPFEGQHPMLNEA